jgi:hypothetical protein
VSNEWQVSPEPDPVSEWLSIEDPDGWWEARVRRDGCFELYRGFNEPHSTDGENWEQIHICDLDDLITRLQALKAMAQSHFGEWPNG